MPLSDGNFSRILTSDDFNIGVGQVVPFTFTYEGKEPAQLLNVYWTYMADAVVGSRGPFIDANTASGFSLGLLWSGNFLTVSQTEQGHLQIGEAIANFFGVTPVLNAIPDDLFLRQGDTLVFTSFFFIGPGDLQDIYFQLGIA